MAARILTGDCRDVLRTLQDESVHCIVSSPPYYGLRDYQVAGQIGLEQSPDAYVAELVGVFRECRRVLRNDGTLWANLGDSYSGHNPTDGGVSNKNGVGTIAGLKPKDLIGIPWLVAFALRADGWYLRSDIIWAKKNCMPESVTDRPTKAHEYLFLLSKNERYYYDAEAIKEPEIMKPQLRLTPPEDNPNAKIHGYPRHRRAKGGTGGGMRNARSVWTVATQPFSEAHFATFPPDLIEPCIKAGTSEKGCCAKCGAPWKRLVEKGDADLAHQRACGGDAAGEYNGTATKDYASAGAQNASEVKARILAGMREKITTGWVPTCKCREHTPVPCTVLDPFGGAGTTALVADRLQRNSIIIELNPEYAAMARRRIEKDAGMFAVTEAA